MRCVARCASGRRMAHATWTGTALERVLRAERSHARSTRTLCLVSVCVGLWEGRAHEATDGRWADRMGWTIQYVAAPRAPYSVHGTGYVDAFLLSAARASPNRDGPPAWPAHTGHRTPTRRRRPARHRRRRPPPRGRESGRQSLFSLGSRGPAARQPQPQRVVAPSGHRTAPTRASGHGHGGGMYFFVDWHACVLHDHHPAAAPRLTAGAARLTPHEERAPLRAERSLLGLNPCGCTIGAQRMVNYSKRGRVAERAHSAGCSSGSRPL